MGNEYAFMILDPIIKKHNLSSFFYGCLVNSAPFVLSKNKQINI
jgi:hypothetical protein